jgi:hypothetical protein
MKERQGALFSWALVGILSVLLVYPSLAYPIEEHSIDGGHFHVYRSVVFGAAWDQGWSFPRWVQPLNAGLGSPIFSFYPPMTYLIMNVLHRLGLPQPLAWRVLVASAFLLAATGAFALGLRLFRRADVALAGSMAFAFAPFLLHELYGRGSPEGIALSLYPWCACLFLHLAEAPSGKGFAALSLVWAISCLTHTLTVVMLLPTLALFALYAARRKGARSLRLPLLSLVHGTLLSAFYLVPFILEQRYIQFENVSLSLAVKPVAQPLTLWQLASLPALLDSGFGGQATWEPRLGPLHVAIALLSLIPVILLLRRRAASAAILAAGAAALGLGALWLQTNSATWVWKALPFLQVLQFRWRLLGIVDFAALVSLGCLLELIPEKSRGALAGAVIVLGIGLQLPSIYPTLYIRWARFSTSPTVEEAQTLALSNVAADLTGHFEFQPRARQAKYTFEEARTVALTPVANLPAGGRIWAEERRDRLMRVDLETPVPFAAALHKLYYPGWVGYLDGQRAQLRPMPDTAYTVVDVPAGRHTVELRYTGTRIQHASEWASLLAALGLLLPVLLLRGGAMEGGLDIRYLRPRWWGAFALLPLVVLKVAWLDPYTSFLRHGSRCGAVYEAQVQTDARFAGQVRLCGYTVTQREFSPGDMVHVTLYWFKMQTSKVGADCFVHLLGSANNPRTGIPVWGQLDKQAPADHPIHTWEQGKLYADEYVFAVEPNTPPGTYNLEIGWYRPTWERLQPEILSGLAELSVCNGALYVPGITVRARENAKDAP